jgi:hypothetical protein
MGIQTKRLYKTGRFSVVLSNQAYEQLVELADKRRMSLTKALTTALSLYQTVVEAQERKQKLFLVSADGKSEREIVFP